MLKKCSAIAFLLDPAQKEAAEQAIMTLFGPLYPDLLPPREVRALPAQYSFLQLKEWFDLIGVLHHMPEVTMSDIDDVLGTNGLVISDVLLLELLELWRSRQLLLAEE